MVRLKKEHAGSAPGYTWEHDGDVLDVDEGLALELLERPDGEFSEAPETEPAPEPEPAPESEGESEEDHEDESTGDDKDTKKPARRTRTKVTE